MDKKDTLVIVDDMTLNRAILGEIFEKEYNLLEAENGEQALVLIQQYHANIAAVLLDLVMPEKDGYQVMEELQKHSMLSLFPVIVITAEDSAESEIKAFDLGASEIIMKPFEPHVVKRRIQNAIELHQRKLYQQEIIEKQAAKLRESNAVVIDALSSIIEYRSIETGQHIHRIRLFTKILLEDVAKSYPEFGLDEKSIEIIVSASSMHDIGKIAIADNILNKAGSLTKEEFEVMKTHTTKGCDMLAKLSHMSDMEYLQYAYNICRYHHERWDGNGYPDGLKGESIPICAQVVGLADCYDALTTDRVYKKAIPPAQAFNMILNGECGVFSPRLLESFKNVRVPFAHFSKEYADKRIHNNAVIKPQPSLLQRQEDTLNTLQIGQMKYFTLLRYTNSTVMEVDLVTGMYHVVYLSSTDFELLKSGNSFTESICNFAENAVHPEDQKMVLGLLGSYMQSFFDNGFMKRSRRYRVYSHTYKDYCWCQATMLRIDTGNPQQRKLMLIWHEVEDGIQRQTRPPMPQVTQLYSGAVVNSLLASIQTCRNDQYFTLLQMNSGLQTLLGYTEKEIKEDFGGRYIEFIYSADRPAALQQTQQQLSHGNLVELEYRMQAKDGRLIWVLDKSQLVLGADGEEYLLCALVDITQSKREQEELRLTVERHKIIMEQANDVIFEWDIENDYVTYSNNWQKKFGYRPIEERASKRIPKISHIHPEDLNKFSALIQQMAGGVQYADMEFRLANAQGYYRWCKIRAVAQFNSAGKPFKVVGVLTDIDGERHLLQMQKEKTAAEI